MLKQLYKEVDSQCLQKMKQVFLDYDKFMPLQVAGGMYYLSFPYYLERAENDRLFVAAVDTKNGCRIYLAGLADLLQKEPNNNLVHYFDSKSNSLILNKISVATITEIQLLLKSAWNSAHTWVIDNHPNYEKLKIYKVSKE